MLISECRTLFKTGDSLAITLPKIWIRHFKLKAGDRVEIVVNDELAIRVKDKNLDSHTDLTSMEQ